MRPFVLQGRLGIGATALVATLSMVVLMLVGIDWYTRGPFFDDSIMPRFGPGQSLLRENSGAGDPTILFDIAARSEHRGIRIAFLGDSTMKAMPDGDDTIVPYLVRESLRRRFGTAEIEVIDASVIGLFAGDALLYLDKLLSADVDVIVYGLLLRALPRQGTALWTTRVSAQLSPSEVERLLMVGGGSWARANIGAEKLLNGVVHSQWKTYAYRTMLRKQLSERLDAQWLALPAIVSVPAPPPARPTPEAPRQFGWTRELYGLPSANWEALDLLGRLCDRYAPRRCLIFAGPINPEGHDALAEPGFYDEYRERLRKLAADYRVVYRDFSDGMAPDDFVRRLTGAGDPIHINAKGRLKLAARVVEPIADIIETEWPAAEGGPRRVPRRSRARSQPRFEINVSPSTSTSRPHE